MSPALGLDAGLAGAAETGWPSFATRRVTAPTVSSSPCFNASSPLTRLPLTKVPFELPRSRSINWSPTSKSSQWRRLTCADLMRMTQSSWRPRLVTLSVNLSVVEALRPRTTWST